MFGKAYDDWMRAGIDAWSLGLEASIVIGQRATKIASGGDPTGAEVRLMVSEKIEAALELQAGLMTGRLGSSPQAAAAKATRHYARKVSANRRRLSR